jgi:hypothetical protein
MKLLLTSITSPSYTTSNPSYPLTLSVTMFAVPLLFRFLSEALGDLLLETIFPPFFTSLLMCNYFGYSVIGFFILGPYLLVLGECY